MCGVKIRPLITGGLITVQFKIYSKTATCPRLFSLLLTVSYNLDFVRISKVFDRIYVACQWGEFRVKNANLSVRILFRRFLLLFVFSW